MINYLPSVREKAQAIVGHYPPSLPYPCPPACKRCAAVEELMALGQEYAKSVMPSVRAEAKAEAFREAAGMMKEVGVPINTCLLLSGRAAAIRAEAKR